jgi:hypothetical protein
VSIKHIQKEKNYMLSLGLFKIYLNWSPTLYIVRQLGEIVSGAMIGGEKAYIVFSASIVRRDAVGAESFLAVGSEVAKFSP